MREVLGRYSIWAVLLVLVASASILSPVFFTPVNLLNIVRQGTVVGVAAVGVTLVMVTGGVDLSVGAVISLAAVLAAGLMAGQNENVPFALGMTLLVGLAIGLLNGVLVAKRRLPPFILTL